MSGGGGGGGRRRGGGGGGGGRRKRDAGRESGGVRGGRQPGGIRGVRGRDGGAERVRRRRAWRQRRIRGRCRSIGFRSRRGCGERAFRRPGSGGGGRCGKRVRAAAGRLSRLPRGGGGGFGRPRSGRDRAARRPAGDRRGGDGFSAAPSEASQPRRGRRGVGTYDLTTKRRCDVEQILF